MSSDTLALTIETDGDITIFAIRNRRVVPEMSEAFEQQARALLTAYSRKWGEQVVKRCWALGDHLWTKYDEKF